MVIIEPRGMINVMGWGGFLALSFAFNIYILSLVNISPTKIDFMAPEKLRIAFNSLAAPKSMPIPVQPERVRNIQNIKEMKVPVAPKEITKPKVAKPQKLLAVETKTQSIKKVFFAKIDIKPEPVVAVPTPRLQLKKERYVAIPIEKKEEESIQAASKSEPIQTELDVTKPKTMASPTTAQSVADNHGHANATVIQNAKYRERTPPRYPRRAYELGQQGSVLLHALVTEEGIARELKIETSSGHRMLDRAALSAVKRWEFVPHMRNGQRVQSWVRVPVNFVIQ